MEIELVEIRDFLAGHPPFDQLPASTLDALPKQLFIRYLRRGSSLADTAIEGTGIIIIRTGALELRDEQDALIDKFGEGDIYTAHCTNDNLEHDLHGITVEDSLFYILPCERFHALCDAHNDFDAYFTLSIRERLRHTQRQIQGERHGSLNLMKVEVSRLVGRAPVSISPQTTIHEAAQIMTAERVSSLLINNEDGKAFGIVTDRDLRTRCIAAGRSWDEPVTTIMSDHLITVPADTPAFEALMIMSRKNIHHLPVMDGKGILCLISDTDLMRLESSNSAWMISDINKADSGEMLAEISRGLPELQIQLVNSGAVAEHIGHAISSIADALTRRLIELAQHTLGGSPVPFVWLAIGSHARREQSIHSDQDHALLLDDSYNADQHGDYFAQLARSVTDGLNACGFCYCAGNVMATNPDWCQPYSTWRACFNKWITRPEKRSMMLASNFFDMRPIYGKTPLFEHLHAEVLEQARANRIFLAHLAANALHHRPPLGFFRNLVLIHDGEHDNTVDLKHSGILPIVDLARIHALSLGLKEINTLKRLHAAADNMTISTEGADNLEDAFEFISTLRVRHQVGLLRRGLAADNYIRPDDLSKLERTHLKDIFSIINTMQNVLANRYQTERFF